MGDAEQAPPGGTPPGDDAQHLLGIGSVVADRWQIVRPIARGGMGSVFEARHKLSKKAVALKVLDLASAYNERHLVRFQREVSVRAEVGHEGIVDVLDAGMDPATGRPFVAMELLEGEPLRERMDRPDVPREPLFRAVREMLEPLAAAHAHGVVHRDLKPENVFLARTPGGGERVKLLDFGIAVHREGQRATLRGVPLGTPNYMSPEQTLDAASVNDRADSWSVGVMLFELATGRTPYLGETAGEIFARTVTEPAPAVHSVSPRVPPRLAALIDRCLQRDPALRPDVPAIARELDAIFPPRARALEPRPGRRSGATVLLAAVAAALVLMVLLGGGVAYVVVRRAAAAERRANQRAQAAREQATREAALRDASVALTPAEAVRRLGPPRLAPPADASYPSVPDGPLVVQLVTDLGCGPCAQHVPATANALEERFPHGVRYTLRFYSTTGYGPNVVAAEAMLEARAQAGDVAYWRLFDLLLMHVQAADNEGVRPDLSVPRLVALASRVTGVDAARMQAALEGHRHTARIQRDIDELDAFAGGQWEYGRKFGIPTFIVHDVVCWPSNQLDTFRAVEQALAGRQPDPCRYVVGPTTAP